MNSVWLLVGVLSVCQVRAVVAAECPDVGVVVVASVFTTLAVVFIVLGIIGFLLWRRRKGLSGPKKLKNESEPSPPGQNHGYANPAFDNDPEMGNVGTSNYVPYKDVSQEARTSGSLTEKELAKKTWSSLPPSDLPLGRRRKSSAGSLDRNNYAGDDGLVEVWLTSQDFIGLGFNIVGSMRDGIFVSQVHNRGPAKESGKFKAGDRILSVAISFENMVYEDALTILSYASPYPVKVTLQKEIQIPNKRKLSDVRTNLNHPLYRSQSVDDVTSISTSQKETLFQPKRSNSEMRYDKSDSLFSGPISRASGYKNIAEEIPANMDDSNDKKVTETPASQINVVVHRDTIQKVPLDRGASLVADTDLPNATVDLNHDSKLKEEVQTQNEEEKPSNFADVFETLSEQDKLDVLKLSYDDPNAVVANGYQIPTQNVDNEDSPEIAEPEIVQIPASLDLRSVPVKPERKKKRSSTNSTPSQSDGEIQASEPSSPMSPSFMNDVLKPMLAVPTEAPPPVPESESEVDEDMITPEQKARAVSINSDKISFEPATPAGLDSSNVSIDNTIVADASFSDMDTTLTELSAQMAAPVEFQDNDPVEEDIIEPSKKIRDNAEIPLPKYDVVDNLIKGNEESKKEVIVDISDTRERHSSSSSSSSSSSEDKDKSDEKVEENIEETKVDRQESVPGSDLGDTLPDLDMNLNFDTESDFFKERFPSRNEKETEGGYTYDISVTELDSMEKIAREEEEKKKSGNQTGKGGIAFEVRDELVMDPLYPVKTTSVHRTVSNELMPSRDIIKHDISTQRPTSLKGESKMTKEEQDSGKLDWSGSRLVRSGSFSDIPQDDSLKDWTVDEDLGDDDLIEKHIEEDSKSPVMKKLTRATLIESSVDGKSDLSDSDSQCRSISESGSDTPTHEDRYDVTNGEDDGIGSSPDNSPITPIADIKSLVSSSVNHGDNEQPYTVTLSATTNDDEDC